jgi:hypothetical protein
MDCVTFFYILLSQDKQNMTSFFTEKLCSAYTKSINEGMDDSEKLTMKCKKSFGKQGVCIQYTGTNSKYKKYKSCRSKTKHIVTTGGGKEDQVMCDSVDDYLFPYLQDMMYPWKDDKKTNVFSEEYTNDTPDYIDYVIVYQQKKFCGLMMIEMNECDKKKPDNLYSVKLICAQKIGKRSAAMQLLGLYLYVLKMKFPDQQYGFLELAGGYRNVIGYCLYSKFNFKPDPTFDCKEYELNNLSNLKMRVEMASIDVDRLIEKVKANDWYDNTMFENNQMICKRCENEACEMEKQQLLMTMQTKYESGISNKKKKENNYISWDKNEDLFSSWIELFDKLSIKPPSKIKSPKKLPPRSPRRSKRKTRQ